MKVHLTYPKGELSLVMQFMEVGSRTYNKYGWFIFGKTIAYIVYFIKYIIYFLIKLCILIMKLTYVLNFHQIGMIRVLSMSGSLNLWVVNWMWLIYAGECREGRGKRLGKIEVRNKLKEKNWKLKDILFWNVLNKISRIANSFSWKMLGYPFGLAFFPFLFLEIRS
jgi:hypothetical protein